MKRPDIWVTLFTGESDPRGGWRVGGMVPNIMRWKTTKDIKKWATNLWKIITYQ